MTTLQQQAFDLFQSDSEDGKWTRNWFEGEIKDRLEREGWRETRETAVFMVVLSFALVRIMSKDRKAFHLPSSASDEHIRAQAERTAWKNLLEWVEIQLLLIRLEQVEFMEVFLPYIYDGRRKATFYELTRDSGFKMLPGATGENA